MEEKQKAVGSRAGHWGRCLQAGVGGKSGKEDSEVGQDGGQSPAETRRRNTTRACLFAQCESGELICLV